MKYALVGMALLLGGCTTQGQLVHDSAVSRGESAIDAANQLAIRQLCKNMTRGSYNRLCQGNGDLCAHLDAMCAAWQGEFKNWAPSATVRNSSARLKWQPPGPVLVNGKWYY